MLHVQHTLLFATIQQPNPTASTPKIALDDTKTPLGRPADAPGGNTELLFANDTSSERSVSYSTWQLVLHQSRPWREPFVAGGNNRMDGDAIVTSISVLMINST